MTALRRLLAGRGGQDLIEYALLIGFLALVVIAAVNGLGQTIYNVFYQNLAQNLFGAGS